MAKKGNSKYPDIGAIMLKKDSNPKEYYLKLNENIEVLVDGESIKLPYINVEKPAAKLKFFNDLAEKQLEDGKIDEETYEERTTKNNELMERYQKGGDLDYITFQLSGTKE